MSTITHAHNTINITDLKAQNAARHRELMLVPILIKTRELDSAGHDFKSTLNRSY